MDRQEEGRSSGARLRWLTSAFGLTFLFFAGMFLRYQVIGPLQADRFVRPAFSQRQRSVPVTLARGNILDRHGVPLHYPAWGNALALFPGEVVDASIVERALKDITGSDAFTGPAFPSGDDPPVKVARSLSSAQIQQVLSAAHAGGLTVIPEEVRYGPGSLACHVVGHIRANAYMDPRDNVGESGLESAFQSTLAGGSPAWSGVVVTAEGGDVPGTGIRIAPPVEVPKDLYTTLDASVQRAVEAVLDSRGVDKGAAIVLDPSTSEVLAMAGRPVFDQNRAGEFLSQPDAPFVNRAISAFTPGSVFKPVIMSLALEKGYVSPDEVFTCTGEVTVGGRKVSCGGAKEGHGSVTVREALAKSCNSTLIQVGLRIPADELVEYAKKCGFGTLTRIPLQDEAAGVLPSPYAMYAGDVANMCIGQGYMAVTPLQVAAFFSAIAADGAYLRPSLTMEGGVAAQVRLFSPETAGLLQEALLMCAVEGTGRLSWVPSYGSAGKTGTAETGYAAGTTHAWFCGWTPVIAPKYVIVVFVEEGGDGPSVAAPIFREIAARLLDTHASVTP